MRQATRSLRLLNLNCRDATRLASESLDRRLVAAERVGLAIHLAICRNCRRHRQNVRLIRDVARRAADPGRPPLAAPDALPDDARTRIRRALARAEDGSRSAGS